IGDQAYLSTFHQIDPLLSIDLSDPTNPQVVGQLKIPGFSSYLQPIGDHFLLGLGHSGDASGHVGGLELELFDVGDATNPTLLFKYDFDGADPNGGSGSQAEYDMHAIQYFAAQGLIALPVWKYESGIDDWKEGMDIIHHDPTAGFSEAGFIEQSGAQRSVRISETIYSVGSRDI